MKLQQKVPQVNSYLVVVGHTSVEPVDTGTAAERNPAVHTAAGGMAAWGTMAGGHTVAVGGTVAVEDKRLQVLEGEDMCAEAVESRHAVDKAFELERAVHTQYCRAAVVPKLQNINKQNMSLI